jgi:hypothetical protein
LANDLVSVQPMSLPAGLIFFMDFTFTNARAGFAAGESLYGGNVVAKGLVDGVTLGTDAGQFYSMASGYTSPTGSATIAAPTATTGHADGSTVKAVEFDPDLSSQGAIVCAPITDELSGDFAAMNADLTTAVSVKSGTGVIAAADEDALLIDTANGDVLLVGRDGGSGVFGFASDNNDLVIARLRLIRRHTKVASSNNTEGLHGVTNISQIAFQVVSVTDAGQHVTGTVAPSLTLAQVKAGETAGTAVTVSAAVATAIAADVATSTFVLEIPLRDNFDGGGSIGSTIGAHEWPLELAADAAAAADGGNKDLIPEIDIKVDSVAVTAVTKKLKAKWSPELGQDLNAYHNLDAEVELTSILSEQIALEIDREIVNDLIQGATAGTYYWSRSPGMFLNRETGTEIGASSAAPDFTGTVSEWYETLIETVNDVSAQIHRKTLRGGANFLVTSPEVANILEFTAGFRASVTADADRGTVGAVNVGSVSKKFDVYVDPYFPRNLILVGRKGGSFLESGYVYAPYVPLQVTPTIFGTEDFVPRKGVMTRYAKKMVRPDMYGLVICRGLLGEAGATS